MIRAFAVAQFFLGVETLAAETIKPTVAVEIDVACLIDVVKKLLHVAYMIVVGGSNEMIVSKTAAVPGRAKGRANPISEVLGIHPRFRRRVKDLIAVLVRAGEIKGLPTLAAIIPRQRIGNDHRIGAAQVRLGVGAVTRGGDVER